MKKVRTITNYDKKRTVFFSLVLLSAIAFFTYMFFLGNTIFDLVARKNAETAIRDVSSKISSLELEVLSYNNQVTLDRAYELGFVNNSDPKFVSRKAFVSLR